METKSSSPRARLETFKCGRAIPRFSADGRRGKQVAIHYIHIFMRQDEQCIHRAHPLRIECSLLTGMPLVDANMRELASSGFMSNRGRQNVASYLALSLGMDWRLGADYFEYILTDYDVCSNWGNWVAAAGQTGGKKSCAIQPRKHTYARLTAQREVEVLTTTSPHHPCPLLHTVPTYTNQKTLSPSPLLSPLDLP